MAKIDSLEKLNNLKRLRAEDTFILFGDQQFHIEKDESNSKCYFLNIGKFPYGTELSEYLEENLSENAYESLIDGWEDEFLPNGDNDNDLDTFNSPTLVNLLAGLKWLSRYIDLFSKIKGIGEFFNMDNPVSEVYEPEMSSSSISFGCQDFSKDEINIIRRFQVLLENQEGTGGMMVITPNDVIMRGQSLINREQLNSLIKTLQ